MDNKAKSNIMINLPVTGMSCASCASTVEKALKHVKGVSQASVNYAAHQAVVEYDGESTRLSTLVHTVNSAGYEVPTQKLTFKIEGMHCASCVNRVEKALQTTLGVVDATVNLGLEEAYVQIVPGVVAVSDLKTAIENTGYSLIDFPAGEGEDQSEELRQVLDRALRHKLVIAVIFSFPILTSPRDNREVPHWPRVSGLLTLPESVLRLLPHLHTCHRQSLNNLNPSRTDEQLFATRNHRHRDTLHHSMCNSWHRRERRHGWC